MERCGPVFGVSLLLTAETNGTCWAKEPTMDMFLKLVSFQAALQVMVLVCGRLLSWAPQRTIQIGNLLGCTTLCIDVVSEIRSATTDIEATALKCAIAMYVAMVLIAENVIAEETKRRFWKWVFRREPRGWCEPSPPMGGTCICITCLTCNNVLFHSGAHTTSGMCWKNWVQEPRSFATSRN